VTPPFDDDALLATLGAALAPEPVEPGPEAMAALHQALDARTLDAADGDSGVVVPFAPPKRRSATWVGIHRLRQPVVAAVAIGVLATSGVAAAGVATDHLPGPTRTVAYDLGLPVTSPALEAARGTMAQLKVALAAHDVAQVLASAALLRTRLAGLSTTDRAQIEASAGDLLAQADTFTQADASGTSTGSGSSAGTGVSTGSGTSSGSDTSNGTTKGGTTSSNGGSTNGSGDGSDRTTPGTSGSSDGGSGGTTPGSGPTGTTEPGDSSGRGSTPGTAPNTTPTTEPGDKGDGSGSKSTTGTTQPLLPE
jgi:hypothetical protein